MWWIYDSGWPQTSQGSKSHVGWKQRTGSTERDRRSERKVKVMVKGPVMKRPPGATEYIKNVLVSSEAKQAFPIGLLSHLMFVELVGECHRSQMIHVG